MKGEVLYLHVLNTADRRIETCLERSVVIERESIGTNNIKIYECTG